MPTDSGYLRLRQICLAATALGPVQHALETVFGLTMVYQDPHVGKYGLENGLFPIGTDFIEVIAPTRPGTAAARFVERSGGRGAYMAIFDCDAPERRAEQASRHGARIVNTIDHPGFRGYQLHPKDCRATMLEFDRSEGAADPTGWYYPAGGDGWQSAARPSPVRRMTHAVVESGDPEGICSHWSALLGTTVDVPCRLATDALDIVFAPCALGESEALSRIGLEVVGADRLLGSARTAGLPVRGGAIALAGVWFELTMGSSP